GGKKYWYDNTCASHPGTGVAKVLKFKLKYSRDGTNWFDVDNGNEFTNSNNENIYFNSPVYAKKIRLYPTQCINKCTITFDYLEHSGRNLTQPIDCEWNWGAWDRECPQTGAGGTTPDAECTDSNEGSGVRTKNMNISRQPNADGLVCPLQSERTQTQTCPPCEPVNCEIGNWNAGLCQRNSNNVCEKELTREIVQQPFHNGTTCPSLSMIESCPDAECPVDCEVSAFGDWTECNKFCGGGEKTRRKNIIKEPIGSGAACPPASELTQSETCGTLDCATSDQKRYVIQANNGSDATCKEANRYWTDIGNTANRSKAGYFDHNIIGGAGGHNNHETYHATKLVRNGRLNASGTCAGPGGCSVPDYGLIGEHGAYGVTLCKSDSNHDLVKKADYFTTEECPSGWSEKLASRVSFDANNPNGEYNLCRVDLSKQGAIDFFNTFEDNQNVLKYKDSCVPGENEKLVWSGDNIKLCKYEIPPEPMYSVHYGSFDTIPSDYVPWLSSNDMTWLQQDAAGYGVPGGGKNYALPLAGDAPQGGIMATVMVPRGPPPHHRGAGWGTSPRKYITKIRTTPYPCNWNARGLCTAAKGWYCCPTWAHPSYQYETWFYGSTNERDDLKGTGKNPKGKKVDGWIYKNPSLFDKTTSQPKIDFHKIVNITPTTTFNNSGFNKWNIVKTRDRVGFLTGARYIYNILLSSQISALNQNTKIYLPYEFTNDGTSVKYAIGTITQNNRAGAVWSKAEIPVNEPFTITTNSKLIGLNPSFNKRYYFRLPRWQSWYDFVSMIR
ncbi:MAG: hypothetical protein HOM61_00680, partial [Candidatus Marinimicrobia bacterium]|nr:hypothetical protein [Candidatus Neomarinimicrobiota bacterium]